MSQGKLGQRNTTRRNKEEQSSKLVFRSKFVDPYFRVQSNEGRKNSDFLNPFNPMRDDIEAIGVGDAIQEKDTRNISLV